MGNKGKNIIKTPQNGVFFVLAQKAGGHATQYIVVARVCATQYIVYFFV